MKYFDDGSKRTRPCHGVAFYDSKTLKKSIKGKNAEKLFQDHAMVWEAERKLGNGSSQSRDCPTFPSNPESDKENLPKDP